MKVLSNLSVSSVAPSFESVDMAPPRRPSRPWPALARVAVALRPPPRTALKAALLFSQHRKGEACDQKGLCKNERASIDVSVIERESREIISWQQCTSVGSK
jgi:hypothetical protein